jgi:hypothetical protein
MDASNRRKVPCLAMQHVFESVSACSLVPRLPELLLLFDVELSLAAIRAMLVLLVLLLAPVSIFGAGSWTSLPMTGPSILNPGENSNVAVNLRIGGQVMNLVLATGAETVWVDRCSSRIQTPVFFS